MTRVLLVEDSPTDAQQISDELNAAEPRFEIIHVSTLKEAAAARGYDVVLLDLGLPDSEGRNTVEGMLAATEQPVVIVSRNGHDELVRFALESGCSDYIVKGSGADVRRAVDHALHRARHSRTLVERHTVLQGVFSALFKQWPMGSEPQDALPAIIIEADGSVLRATPAGASCVAETGVDLARLMAVHRRSLAAHQSVTEPLGAWDLMLAPRPNHQGQAVGIFFKGNGQTRRHSDPSLAHHHFRTPITPILLDASTLQMTGADERRVQRIKQNAARLQRFAAQYVDLVALDQGTLPLHQEPTDLAPFLGRLGVAAHVPARLDAVCDPKRFEALVREIVQRGDEVAIEARVEDSEIVVEVTLRGWQGAAPDDLLTPYEVPSQSDPGGLEMYLGRRVLRATGGDLELSRRADDLVCILRLPHVGSG